MTDEDAKELEAFMVEAEQVLETVRQHALTFPGNLGSFHVLTMIAFYLKMYSAMQHKPLADVAAKAVALAGLLRVDWPGTPFDEPR